MEAGPALGAPSPNPSSGSSSVVLTLGAEARVQADLFDALGRRVAVVLGAGAHHLAVDGSGLPGGTYAVQVDGGAGAPVTLTQRLTWLR